MGAVKEWALMQEERGYSAVEGAICAECVNDTALKAWIEANVTADQCTFCGNLGVDEMAAEFDDFVGKIVEGIFFKWNHPDDEGIMYIGREGGYQAPISDLSDVLSEYDISDSVDVIGELEDAIDDNGFVERDFYRGTEGDNLRWGWDRFKEAVKHTSRYFFLTPEDEVEHDYGEEIKPHMMLDAIASIITDRLDYVITTITPDTNLIRLRVAAEPQTAASAIGTPPAEFANQSNRMSPAGVPMFYGAFDYATAHAETIDPEAHEGLVISAGTFRATRDLRVLDLANLPDIPSIFDEENRNLIHTMRFLHSFASDISKPIARDGREHIEYVPTQIVTEYFRRVFRIDGRFLDGISYQSSKEGGNVAFVLFCKNRQCIDDEPDRFIEPLVRLVSVAHS